MKWLISAEDELVPLVEQFVSHLEAPNVIYLSGDLGVGKTTLTRYILRALGYQERVKSPTFTLMETHPTETVEVFHLDLYRLMDEDELEYLGLRDCLHKNSIMLVEWPERAKNTLPEADLICNIDFQGEKRCFDWQPQNERTRAWLKDINKS